MRCKSPGIFNSWWPGIASQLPGPAGVKRPQALRVLLQQGLLAARVHGHPQLPRFLPLLPLLLRHWTFRFYWRWLEVRLRSVPICIGFQCFILLLFLFQFFLFPKPFLLPFFSFLSSTFVGSILHSEWLFCLFFLSLDDPEEEDEEDVDEEEDDLLCFLDICLISSFELLNTGFSFFSFFCFFDFFEDPDLLLDPLLLLLETESLLLLDAASPLLLLFFDIDSPLLLLDDLDLLRALGVLLLDLLREDCDLLLLLSLGLGMA